MGMTPPSTGRRPAMSDINVTPLVDVMLVLLIIFMVTAPLMQHGVDVDLPKTTAQAIPNDSKIIILQIQRDRSLRLDDQVVDPGKLEQAIIAHPRIALDKEIYLQADRALPYGYVVDILARIRRAGVTNIGMVTDPSAGPDGEISPTKGGGK